MAIKSSENTIDLTDELLMSGATLNVADRKSVIQNTGGENLPKVNTLLAAIIDR
jgi:hypothetical protein